MKLGIIISTDDAETCWNALRFASFGLKQGDEARVFLIGRGVDYQRDSSGKFNTTAQGEDFLKAGGKIFACGTCIKNRSMGEVCEISNMETFYKLVMESERTVYF